VLLKASFATSYELDGPSVHTSAFRSWTLVDEVEFADAGRVDTPAPGSARSTGMT
jgi:hypothetical protein